MFKTPIKGEGQIIGEYSELSDKEKLREAQTYIKNLKRNLDRLQGDAMLYRRLRQLEVIIMAEDGAKYLKGKDLDDYVDTLPHRGTLTRAEMLKELTPELNNIFAKEYAKYQDEHADAFAAQIDAEVMRNVHKA